MEAWDFAEPLSKRSKCPFRPFLPLLLLATDWKSSLLQVTHRDLSLSGQEREEKRGDEIASDDDSTRRLSLSLFHFDLFQRFGKEGGIRKKRALS